MIFSESEDTLMERLNRKSLSENPSGWTPGIRGSSWGCPVILTTSGVGKRSFFPRRSGCGISISWAPLDRARPS